MHKDIYIGYHEYIAHSIIVRSSNRSSRKCKVMKFMQCSTSLAYYEFTFLCYFSEKLEFTAM